MRTDTMRLRELTVRYTVKTNGDGQPVRIGPALASPRAAAAVLMTVLQAEPTEVFAILCLTTKHRIIAYHEVSRGTLDSTIVHPRDVFKAALLANAAAVILVHNHPSGEPGPSEADCELTRRLVEAGDLLGIQVLDHIIIGEGRFVSLRELGRM